MNDKVIRELHKDNLCTYFILPLLKLNKFRFLAESNFVDSYLSQNKLYIFVEVLETMFIEHKLMLHPQFSGLYSNNNTYFIRYKIPDEFINDVELFTNGKYSKMSEKSKTLITENSGLAYKQLNDDGNLVTDIRLTALNKSLTLKQLWEDFLDVNLDSEMELLSIPKLKTYLKTTNFTKINVNTMSE